MSLVFSTMMERAGSYAETFPNNRFRINVYKNFRCDRNRFEGGLVFHLNENIPCKILQQHEPSPNFEIIAIEFYHNNQKWLLLGLYKRPIFT